MSGSNDVGSGLHKQFSIRPTWREYAAPYHRVRCVCSVQIVGVVRALEVAGDPTAAVRSIAFAIAASESDEPV